MKRESLVVVITDEATQHHEEIVRIPQSEHYGVITVDRFVEQIADALRGNQNRWAIEDGVKHGTRIEVIAADKLNEGRNA